MNNNMRRTNHKPAPMKFTLADRLLAAGQRLRADEAVVRTTLDLNFAAKWQQVADSRKGAAR